MQEDSCRAGDEYLKDVEYFVKTFGKNTTGNRSAYVFSSGIISNGKGHRFGAIYVLKALRKDVATTPIIPNGSIASTIFEQKISAQNGLVNNCEPDVRIGTDKILEFKSWSPNGADTDIGSMGDDEIIQSGYSAFNKLAENNYAKAPNSYTQFLCYLSNISKMSDLEYYFDKDYILQRGQSDPKGYVKSKFQALLMISIYREDVFNTIWNNQKGLKNDLFQNKSKQDAEDYFKDELVSKINSNFYEFIKVK